jgi:hypothetical protein
MKLVRLGFAALAAAALIAIALVAGVATPWAFAKSASPSGGAAQAVYCPKGKKDAEHAAIKAFEQMQKAEKEAFFRTHPSGRDRAAFLKRQHEQREAFLKKHKHCQ